MADKELDDYRCKNDRNFYSDLICCIQDGRMFGVLVLSLIIYFFLFMGEVYNYQSYCFRNINNVLIRCISALFLLFIHIIP